MRALVPERSSPREHPHPLPPDALGFQVSPSCTPTPTCSLGTSPHAALPDARSSFHGPHPTPSSANPLPPPWALAHVCPPPGSNAQGVGPRRAVGVGTGSQGWGGGGVTGAGFGGVQPRPHLKRLPLGARLVKSTAQPSPGALQSGIHVAVRTNFPNTHLPLSPATTSEGPTGRLQPFWLPRPPLASRPCALQVLLTCGHLLTCSPCLAGFLVPEDMG